MPRVIPPKTVSDPSEAIVILLCYLQIMAEKFINQTKLNKQGLDR
jgi:hypothetical protein